MSPLFSIVIANYNHGAFLEDAIRSLRDQSCQDFELIIVDGGSTDNSVEVIRKYSEHIAWWCSEKDSGQSDAFNKGFARAKGLWGCWLNADDLMMPHALQAVKEVIASRPHAEWVSGGTVFCDARMNVLWCSRCLPHLPFITRRIPVLNVNGPSSFFKLPRLREAGGFDTRLHFVMDLDLWMRFFNAGMQVHYIPHYLWAFRVHALSKTSFALEPTLSPNTNNETNLLFERYNRNARQDNIVYRFVQLIKLLSGAYLLSYLDTKRYRGKHISSFRLL